VITFTLVICKVICSLHISELFSNEKTIFGRKITLISFLLTQSIPNVEGKPVDSDGLCHLGCISPTYLRAAFTPIAPKSVRVQSSCQYLFTLLGSTGAKGAHKILVKLTPG